MTTIPYMQYTNSWFMHVEKMIHGALNRIGIKEKHHERRWRKHGIHLHDPQTGTHIFFYKKKELFRKKLDDQFFESVRKANAVRL
jgi:hypothetical protein